MTVLVTGGRGTFGTLLVPRLQAAGHDVVITSRSAGPGLQGTDRRVLDLTRDELSAAVLDGVDVIVHAASNPARPAIVDVRGTALLTETARRCGIAHLFYLSIVGVDDHPFFYYRAKAAAERRIEESGVPHTILRVTQFHEFLDRIFGSGPFIATFPGFEFQVIDGRVVADRTVDLLEAGPAGRVSDLGGPQAEPMGAMAGKWRRAAGSVRPVVPVPVFGRTAAAFRRNRHHTPHRAAGTRTWDDWLRDTYGPAKAG